MNYENADPSFHYGLRVSYRLKGHTEIINQDFYGRTKGEDSAKFEESLRGQTNWLVVHTVVPEANAETL